MEEDSISVNICWITPNGHRFICFSFFLSLEPLLSVINEGLIIVYQKLKIYHKIPIKKSPLKAYCNLIRNLYIAGTMVKALSTWIKGYYDFGMQIGSCVCEG